MKKTRVQVEDELREAFERKLKEVLDWGEEHPGSRLIELEEYLLEMGKEITGMLAEGVVEQRESRQPVEAPACDRCGQPTAYKGQKRKRVMTQVGEVAVERGYYWCEHCRRGVFPPG
jgi:hypothetical protein